MHGGGGNAWHGFTYDAELDQLYIGTGNGSPWNRKIRSPGGGDNLFLCSIVALNPDTRRIHLALPDDAGRDLGLQLEHGHRAGRPADRRPGAQGDPARAEERLLLRDRSHEREADLGRAVHRDDVGERHRSGDRPARSRSKARATSAARPRSRRRRSGGHNWQAMSFNPKTGLAYYPAMHITASFTDAGIDLGELAVHAVARRLRRQRPVRHRLVAEGRRHRLRCRHGTRYVSASRGRCPSTGCSTPAR